MMVNSFFFFFFFIFSLPLFIQTQRTYVDVYKNWDDARKYCREYHTDLAVFENQTEFEALENPCGQHNWCWIGLYREATNLSSWKWVNGKEVGFLPWKNPTQIQDSELCAVMKEKLWYAKHCTSSYTVLCYNETMEEKEDKEDLILVKEKKTWEEALEHCLSLQLRNDSVYELSHMTAEISNQKAKDLIQDAQTQEVWIGLRFLAGLWFWADEFPVEQQLKNQLGVCPDPMMHCGTMSKTGEHPLLRDCSEKKNFLCFRKNLE